jgi:hypothetical protein
MEDLEAGLFLWVAHRRIAQLMWDVNMSRCKEAQQRHG